MSRNFSNGFENQNKKSLSEQVNDICKSTMNRQEKINALVKLGIRENEIQFIMPVYGRVKATTERKKAFKYTFGVEIECVMPRNRFEAVAGQKGVRYNFERYNHIDNKEYFKFTSDSSIYTSTGREGDPIECVSPVLDGTKKGFDKLSLCCEALNEANAYVNRSTGLHVHIGAGSLTPEQYVNVFKNYKALQSVISSFLAPSRRNAYFCAPISLYDFDNCHTPADVRDVMNNDRYHSVNPIAYSAHGTIEFRQHQGTTNFTKIKNWVSFLAKLVAYSTENVIENEITSIDEIPFLTATEKRYFNSRKAAFEGNREREVA